MIERITNNQLYHLVMANIRELMREPGVLFWGIVFPILMSLGLGIAFTKKKDIITTVAVIGRNHLVKSPDDSASIIRNFLQINKAGTQISKNGGYSKTLTIRNDKMGNTMFIFQAMDWKHAMVLLKRGNLNLILDEKNGAVQYHFDPNNPDAQLAYLKLTKLFSTTGRIATASDTEIAPLTVSGTRYIDFLVPGLIAMGVMMSSMWGISYAIIERRSKKLLRRMVATPMKHSNFLIALITVRVLMNFVEAGLLFLFAFLAFDITIQGNVPALLTLFIAGNFAFAGISIFISSNTAKTEIGNGLINAFSMPMMVLSGIFFSYHNFPVWSIPVIQQFPLTLMADGMRSIFIEGAGFSEASVPIIVLSSIGLVFFVAGMKIFRWH
ncbi:MAG: ABC transporter permease [Bacteroidales bacterium]|jgi:ABC-type multidrug transport system permease subunit|nr:ABC transporter permease [Bacteroidales bacterium]